MKKKVVKCKKKDFVKKKKKKKGGCRVIPNYTEQKFRHKDKLYLANKSNFDSNYKD